MLQDRIRKKLTESTEWYKQTRKEEESGDEEEKENREFREKTWKEWRQHKRWKKKKNRERREGVRRENREIEGKKLQGVLFIAHTRNSELAKRVRNSLEKVEKFSRIKLKVVERAGQKISDILHKLNPWSRTPCNREECRICTSGCEKLWGRCRDRNLVYETECLLCKPEEGNEKERENENWIEKKTGEKRKADEGGENRA